MSGDEEQIFEGKKEQHVPQLGLDRRGNVLVSHHQGCG